VDVLDFKKEPLALYDPDTAHDLPGYAQLKTRVERADVVVLGTPDYHGSVSGAMKNFLDHFWREFAGKLFATIVASHEKGLTVTDQLRTVARQCYAWTLPYGVSFTEEIDVKAVLSKVELDEADAGLVYATDAVAGGDKVKAVDIPTSGENLNTYPIAALTGSENTATAEAFVDYVLSPVGAAELAAAGFRSL